MRVFVGIKFPDELYSIVKKFKSQNHHLSSIRWVQPQNLHLTLSFLGEMDATSVCVVQQTLDEIIRQYEPFSLKVEKIDFSPGKKPYMFWLYLERNTIFEKLYQQINEQLNHRPYRKIPLPHVTLARLKKAPQFFKPVFPEEVSKYSFFIDAVCLYQSHLKHSGADYQILSRHRITDIRSWRTK